MSRIKCERGISYDEERKVYYLYTELGRDANGKRLRRYSTQPFPQPERRETLICWKKSRPRQSLLPSERWTIGWRNG